MMDAVEETEEAPAPRRLKKRTGPEGATALDQPRPEPEPEPKTDDPEPRAAERRPWWPKVAVALAFVLLAVTTGITWLQANDLQHKADNRKAVEVAAGRFGQALLSYDFQNVDDARAKIIALSTDTFAQNYNQAFTNGLSAAILQLKARATANVRDVFVTDVSGGKASAMVVLDSVVSSAAGLRTLTGSYLRLDMLRVKGVWKIDQVLSVSASDDSLSPSSTTTTPTTTSTTAP